MRAEENRDEADRLSALLRRRVILVVDLVESVRLMQADESDVIARWRHFVREVRGRMLPATGARVVKSLGDGLMLEFESAPDAIRCAIDMHRTQLGANQGIDAERAMWLRIGAHAADVVVDEDDIYGHGVNLAARVATLARPGETVITSQVRDQIVPGLDADVQDMGQCWVKHLTEPVVAFRVAPVRPLLAIVDGLPEHLAPKRLDLRPVIAVLPFAPRTGSASDPWLGDIIADDAIVALSALPELQVISRLSCSAIAGRSLSTEAVGKLLGADFVVAGAYFTIGDRLSLHIELSSTSEGTVVDAFALRTSIASLDTSALVSEFVERVAAALVAKQVNAARVASPPNLASHTLLLGGIALMHRFSRSDFIRAHELLTHLVERWPRFATSHAWLARWHMFSVLQGWSASPDRDRRAAVQSASRALDTDASSSVALAVSGAIEIALNKDIDRGLQYYEAALAANPNDSLAWLLKGTAHAFKGDGPDAVDASGRAIRLSPLDPMRFLYDCHAAGALLAAGRYADACVSAERSMRSNAGHLSTYRVLAAARALNGEMGAASETVQRLLELDPRQSVEGFLAGAPSAAFDIGRRLAEALAQAGLPLRSSKTT